MAGRLGQPGALQQHVTLAHARIEAKEEIEEADRRYEENLLKAMLFQANETFDLANDLYASACPADREKWRQVVLHSGRLLKNAQEYYRLRKEN